MQGARAFFYVAAGVCLARAELAPWGADRGVESPHHNWEAFAMTAGCGPMDDAAVYGRLERILLIAMCIVEGRGYNGAGVEWLGLSPAKLAGVIARREHEPVLRSESFARKLWSPRIVANMRQRWMDLGFDRWKKHHAAIQKADPLEYVAAQM